VRSEIPYMADQLADLTYFIIKVRYHSNINTGDRVKHEGKAYEILEVDNIFQRNQELTLYCRGIL
jgi:SPP1 family predicted phage head-tail adaptor